MNTSNTSNTPNTPHRIHGRPRRGMMLLIVLVLLTMFLLVGTLMLVNTTRSRTTARAFAAATASNSSSTTVARRLLDEALMKLVCGPSNPAANDDVTESLLEDKYGRGTALTGTLLGVQDAGPLLTATIDAAVSNPVELNGRIVTFVPKPEDRGDVASYRILKTTGSATPFTCTLANLRPARPPTLPVKACPAIINGPEFRAEAYDAFDDNNRFLTQVVLEDCAVKSVSRPAFGTGSPTVDNDADGVADGVWLTGVLPSLPTSDGGMLDFAVSYLVLDLDSRLNVNAHGSSTSIDFPAAMWTNSADVPIGNGYGPADVDASLLFVDPLAKNQLQTNPPTASAEWTRIIKGGTAAISGTASTATQRRPTPLIGNPEGRYGTAASATASAVPGTAGNDPLSQIGEAQYSANQTIDLKSRIKTWMDTTSQSTGAVPTLMYYTPDWNAVGFSDDPYEMRLDIDGPRPTALGASRGSNADNPFTPAELERVLRQFDPDAAILPQRLAAVLDNFVERSRMLATTDSWDTPALTGDVAAQIAAFAKGLSKPYEILSPDVVAGLRFDINRQLLNEDANRNGVLDPGEDTNGNGVLDTLAASKQNFCKHLYTLLVALGQPANSDTAQWAVNALSYRTADSAMTRFQFDRNLADGWQVNDTDVVWGAERPELVIAQTIAWRTQSDPNAGELYVTLYHPWSAKAVRSDGTQVPIDMLSPDLGSNNKLDLRRTAGSDPVWRLRFDGNKFVRFDAMTTPPANTFGSSKTLQNDATQMAASSYLCVTPPGKSTEGISVDSSLPTFVIDQGGIFRSTTLGNNSDSSTDADTVMYLDRLADPTAPFNAITNPYIAVDKLGIKLVNRSGGDPNNWRSFFRSPPFWKNQTFSKTMKPPKLIPLDMNATNWFPWPNRSFISQAELALVPQGDALAMLAAYDVPKNKKSTYAYFLPTDKLLDAAIVPSRFTGASIHVPDLSALSGIGMETFPANQISRWREPGRVNLNTIPSNTSCSDVQLNDVAWWATVGQDANVAWSDYASVSCATSIRDMLTLKQGTTMYQDTSSSSDDDDDHGNGNGSTNGNSWKKNRQYDFNPALTYATAMRLANVATIRSNVFAVWITLRVTDRFDSAAAPAYHRVFAIIDRSVPVGFDAGEPLNARETIRLQRLLE